MEGMRQLWRGRYKDTEGEREREMDPQREGNGKEERRRRVGPHHCSEPPGQGWVAGPSFPAHSQGCCLVGEVVRLAVHTDAPSSQLHAATQRFTFHTVNPVRHPLKHFPPNTQAPFLNLLLQRSKGKNAFMVGGEMSRGKDFSTEVRASG